MHASNALAKSIHALSDLLSEGETRSATHKQRSNKRSAENAHWGVITLNPAAELFAASAHIMSACPTEDTEQGE